MNDDLDRLRKKAGEKAAEYVKNNQVVGLGTGRTVKWTIMKLGELVRTEGLKIVGIPTSKDSERLAKKVGIPLTDLVAKPVIDITIDGADEVDPDLNLIKGHGGALTREKIVASCSKKEIIVVDYKKIVKLLGTEKALPVEVLPFAWNVCQISMAALNSKPVLRMENDKKEYVTDNGNYILNCKFDGITNPLQLEQEIINTPGVVENGLFLNLVNKVIVASKDGVEILSN